MPDPGGRAASPVAKRLVAAGALALAGPLVIPAAALLSGGSLSDLSPASLLTAERLLPLFGLGLLLGQLRGRATGLGLVLLVAGAGLGIAGRELFFRQMATIPGAAAHMFLTGPLACVLIGLPLVLPDGLRRLVAPPLLVPAAGALAIATVLGDPTLHARGYLPSALAAQAWLVALIAFGTVAMDRPWLSIAVRIVASWLIAIGLLYGGAHLAAKRTALELPPFPALPDDADAHGFGPLLRQIEGGGN